MWILLSGLAVCLLASIKYNGVDLHAAFHFLGGVIATLVYVTIEPFLYSLSNPLISPWIRRRRALARTRNVSDQLDLYELSDGYGLEHALLNLDFNPKTMWVNHGLWKNQTDSLSAAGDALFQDALKLAGISRRDRISVLEVGCACAEPAMLLSRNSPDLLVNYVGLTNNKTQAEFASKRLASLVEGVKPINQAADRYHVFVADAAKPTTWSREIQTSIASSFVPAENQQETGAPFSTWLLALDALYHFEPTRHGILRYAHDELNASLLASDIIISDDCSRLEGWCLRFMLHLMQIPWTNVLTKAEYLVMLVDCGYDKANISIEDHTENTFVPYVEFFHKQGIKWEALGGSWDYWLPYRLGTAMISWWARSGKVRHITVAAHHGRRLQA